MKAVLLDSYARFATTKEALPATTLYLVMSQLGIVRDLSVQRPEGHIGVGGMVMPSVVVARRHRRA